jgi:uncharacterized protein YecE (DUF72 family)
MADKKILLGTSSFTAKGWNGIFYPKGLKDTDRLSYYAEQFNTVEIDATWYATPALSTVNGWYARTPPGFLFAAKVPQVITHEKILLNCDEDLSHFLGTMDSLKEKLGPLLLQFGKFDQYMFKTQESFLQRLEAFLKKLPKDYKFAVEIRNKSWIDAKYADLLRQYGVAMALVDQSQVLRPWDIKEKFDLVTSDFTYIRWLGDRKGIEKLTTTFDKTVEDHSGDLKNWVNLLRTLVSDKRIRKLVAYANNHYEGHAPSTLKTFSDLWEK